ncbi:FBP domain-containing protein [Agromyces aerolatus]|uniref:FBP domain-containing protein n=1 Tax=Agromyces sp. LY-1074 TaxID=3074080 RepID=UPI00285DF7CD|nr:MULTISPECIES: FBP domain-containing protein [unclassified Agromyces]MDR5701359.1 FBP domain-containing protein [Agromyces sp. LY-1074]MDR5706852.1 FBP domain-containing protein [Agromyces sp. LY-1358]
MRPLSEDEIRASFVNSTDAELDQLELPLEHLLVEWDEIDALAWRDRTFRQRGYLVTMIDDEPVGLVLRASEPPASRHRAAMCNLCHTQQPANQVSMFSARRAGLAGEKGDSVGTYLCTDLSCQENVRLHAPLAPAEVRANAAMRVDGLRRRTRAFVEGVLQLT